MGQTIWSDLSKSQRDPLTWDVCQRLYDMRGYKPLRLRLSTDKNNLLDYKSIASYTYIAWDGVRNSWAVFLKYWHGNNWRKIAEVCLNDKWRIFSDTDDIYSGSRVGLRDVRNVMALSDEEFQSDKCLYMSNLARHRLNQILPSFIYNKKGNYYINNKHLPFYNGITVSYQTSYSFPRWWKIAPHPWRRHSLATEYTQVSEQHRSLAIIIKDYARQFVNATYQKPPLPVPSWLRALSTENLATLQQERHRQVVPWEYFSSERADIKLYMLIIRASLIGTEDEIRDLGNLQKIQGYPDFYKHCFPVYLLHKALLSETIWDKSYIHSFLEDYQRSESAQHEAEDWSPHSSERDERLRKIAKILLKKYLQKFLGKFLLIRCTDIHNNLITGQVENRSRYGSGVNIPNPMRGVGASEC